MDQIYDYGEILGDTFERIEQIGQGGGGTVFRAHHKRLDIDVVLKKIHTAQLKSIDSRAELDILKTLKHPYIPQVFDFIEYGVDIFTVMELIPGQSFEQLLKQKQRFRQKDVIKWAEQLCEVAAYLHAQDPPIIHCDIKPANVMLTPKGDICLIDFNISGVKTEEGIAAIGYSDGYSPAEQFAAVAGRAIRMRQKMRQDPAVDPGSKKMPPMPGSVFARMGDGTEITEIDEERMKRSTEVTEINTEITEIDAEVTEIDSKEEKADSRTAEKNVISESSLLKSISDENWIRARQITAYMGDDPVLDERADIYGIGAVLYHILTGVRPAPFYLSYVPVEKAGVKVSESFAYVINRSLAVRPEDRFKSSAQLLKTVRNLSAFDRRYKSLVHRQTALAVSMAGLAAASFITIFAGRDRMGQEIQNTYHAYVEAMAQAREDGDYNSVQESYMQAWQLMADEQEAYYEMAMAYYDQKAYEDCVRFLEENVFANTLLTKDSAYGRFYYLCGRCYLELERYGEAAEQYAQAVELQPEILSYYSDYVIALARDGHITEAEEILGQAVSRNVSGEVLSLLQGEIALAKGDIQTAEQFLQECIDISEDDYNLLRAYSKLDEVYQSRYQNEQQYEKRITLLSEALERLPEAEQITLTERLAQVYIDYGELSGEQSYDQKAIELFRRMEERGNATFMGQLNIAILYEKGGDYAKAGEQLRIMLERFPDNYMIYKRLARLELEIQAEQESKERDYHVFETYYKQAKAAYAEYAGTEDTEMLLLDQLYEDVAVNGWL